MSISNYLLKVSGSVALFFLVSGTLLAQRIVPKYENVYKEASAQGNSVQAYSLYADYLSLNPTSMRANLYFQLAELSSSILRDIDPILHYDDFVKFADEARTNTARSLQYLTDAEVKRDRDLFVGVSAADRRLSVQDVQNYLTKKKVDDSIFIRDIETIRNGFAGVVGSYTRSNEMFTSISKRYFLEDDLYAAWNKELELELQAIVTRFDSVRFFVEEYREALVKRPTKGYLVNYGYAKIDNLRLNGFSPVNFTDPQAVLWDYGQWAERVLKYFDSKVRPLRREARVLDSLLWLQIQGIKDHQADLSNETLTENHHQLLSDLLKSNVNSVLEAEIRRKLAQIDFLSAVNKQGSRAEDEANWSTMDQANFYLALHDSYSAFEAATKELERRATIFHSDALLASSRQAFGTVNKVYDDALRQLKEDVLLYENTFRQMAYLEYKKQDIPFYLGNGFYRATAAGYVTKSIVPDRSGGFYLSGSSINAQGFAVAFIAYSANGQSVNWFKTIDVDKMMYDDCGMSITLAPNGGCYALVSSKSVSDPSLTTQTVLRYDSKGDEKLRLTLPEKTLPLGRDIRYDPSNNSLLLTFYGKDEQNFEPDGNLVIQQIGVDNTQLFRTDVQLNGSLLTVVPIEESNSFLLVGNYSTLKTLHGNYRLKEGFSGVFSLLVDTSGKIVKTNVYPVEASYYAVKAVRMENGNVMLLGEQGPIRKNSSDPYPNNGKPVCILTDNGGKLLYTNVRLKEKVETPTTGN